MPLFDQNLRFFETKKKQNFYKMELRKIANLRVEYVYKGGISKFAFSTKNFQIFGLRKNCKFCVQCLFSSKTHFKKS